MLIAERHSLAHSAVMSFAHDAKPVRPERPFSDEDLSPAAGDSMVFFITEDTDDEIRRYIKAICRTLDLKPSTLAKHASINPTTVTRFLNQTHNFRMKDTTLTRIQRTALKQIQAVENHVTHGLHGCEDNGDDLRFWQDWKTDLADLRVALEQSLDYDDMAKRDRSISRQEMVFLPLIDQAAAAGAGMYSDAPEIVAEVPFLLEQIQALTRTPTDNLALIRVAGDSMWPTLHDGDQVLIDRSVRTIRRDGVYVLRAGNSDDIQVKRIQWEPGKTVRIISDNTLYEPFAGVDPDDLAVLGQVCWLGRRV